MQLFTVEQANRTLPLVRRIVADIVETYERWQGAVRAFELASLEASGGEQSADAAARQRDAERLAEEIAGFVRELEAIGVEFKGYDVGLVDFPARLGDRTVYLCWRLGEPEVRYWHELNDGFAGRQPIEALAFA
ncbi:MAG: DUF2203 domain-containing protein [Gemmatimonadaceae bacterium]|nr:DUF2203 domain-containing protein [Gemmatimonadaceae bacterium]NUQ94054.1 DUF2203 domain-containing protein [Gemmatimonadaceae bacterium]NUR17942.1 DUF2203 domain-containing protein [Gemmatimonadaceae bacterium]NUS98704.1 DUF2203 domain-containing protein [Gemmatimonadaceae bacterium]